jgi:hypothetical protein
VLTRTNDLQIFATHEEACVVSRKHYQTTPREIATANGMTAWVVVRMEHLRSTYLRDDGTFN